MRPGRRGRGSSLALVALLAACARPVPPLPPAPSSAEVPPPRAAPPPGAIARGWTEEGVASWYGDPFHGRRTASGEVYDMDGPTAAHKTLPFGTRLLILNLDNGRSTELTVNDRGPFVGARIIDVSRRGARELGMIGPGLARVRIEVLDAPAPPPDCWEVQVGAFGVEANARRLEGELRAEGLSVRVVPGPGGLLRVVVGPVVEVTARGIMARRGGFLIGCARG